MLTPDKILHTDYLESRCALLEIAATMDRYDNACKRTNPSNESSEKLDSLRQALALLAKPETSNNRAEQLLHLFAKV